MRCRLGRVSLSLVFSIAAAHAACRATGPDYVLQIRDIVEQEAPSAPGPPLSVEARQDVRRFYRARAFTPAWFDGRRGRAQLSSLGSLIAHARRHGFDPDDFDPAQRLHDTTDDKQLRLTEGVKVDREQVAELDVCR